MHQLLHETNSVMVSDWFSNRSSHVQIVNGWEMQLFGQTVSISFLQDIQGSWLEQGCFRYISIHIYRPHTMNHGFHTFHFTVALTGSTYFMAIDSSRYSRPTANKQNGQCKTKPFSSSYIKLNFILKHIFVSCLLDSKLIYFWFQTRKRPSLFQSQNRSIARGVKAWKMKIRSNPTQFLCSGEYDDRPRFPMNHWRLLLLRKRTERK